MSDNKKCSQTFCNFLSLVFVIIFIGVGMAWFYIPWLMFPEGPWFFSIFCIFSVIPFSCAWCICSSFEQKFPLNSFLRYCIVSLFTILWIGSGLAIFIVWCLTDGQANPWFGILIMMVSLLPIICGWCNCYCFIKHRYSGTYLTKNDPSIAQKKDEIDMQEYLSNYWQEQQVNTKN